MLSPAEIAQQQVFSEGPILAAILEGFELGELTPLLRISRFFFAAGARLIWREVPGLEVLVNLIVEGSQIGGAPSPRRPATIPVSSVDPSVLGLAQKFARFKIYKGFVRKLYVYGRHGELFSVGDKEYFRPRFAYRFEGFPTAEFGKRPLELPNLREVVVDRHQNQMTWTELQNVLCWFVGPSCISLRLSGSFNAGRDSGDESVHGGGNAQGLINALKTLFTGASKLRTLELWLQPDSEQFDEGSALAGELHTMPLLTTLSISPFMLEADLFEAIATLPALRCLKLGCPGLIVKFRQDPSEYCNPPAGSFPSLTRLEILGTNWYREVTTGITRIPGLLANLESLRYYHTSESATDDDDAPEDEGEDLKSALERLMTEAPKLGSLILGCRQYEVHPVELTPLASLKCVELWGCSLDGGSTIENLLVSCPQWYDSLVSLKLRDESIPLADLRVLAKCRVLEHLEIGLRFSGEALPAGNVRPAESRGFRLDSSFNLGALSDELICTYARFLLSCWWGVGLFQAERNNMVLAYRRAAMVTFRKLVRALSAVKDDILAVNRTS
ncbi:hypothetical protein FRC09_005636 [Ceratobasidium sp. 395]|nr:hypothetical protein FRC09_005636 [Ceratobasidium sp. 395]